MTVNSRQRSSSLRLNCLSFIEILALPVAAIAPTAMPSVTIPLVFASAGKGTWLAFLVATIGVVLVSLNINHFARRSASPGSLYAHIAYSLGPAMGFISGLGLLIAYLFLAMTVASGFTMYADIVLGAFSFHLPPIFLYIVCVGIAWFYAYTDIQLSAVIMLIFEMSSVSFLLLLAGIVLFRHGLKIDTSQILLEGVSFQNIQFGVVLAVLCYVGFESPPVLGDEAKKPLLFIPRAVIWSTVFASLVYILLSYTEVLGFSNYKTSLDKSDVPLSVLAEISGVTWLGVMLSVGVTVSFLSCTLAAINAGARILFSMARHGIFHSSIGRIHMRNETPYVAICFSALLVLLVPAAMLLLHLQVLDIYGYLGSIATYGFLLAYVLISVAAPIYLRRQKKLRSGDVVVAVLAILFLLVPIVGSVYPVPSAPYNIFPYLFLILIAAGGCWFFMLHRRSPQVIVNMKRDLEAVNRKFSGPKVS